MWKSDLCSRLLKFCLGLLAVTEIIVCDESKKAQEQTAIVGTSYKMKCTRQQKPTFTPSTTQATITIWSVNGSLPRGPKYKLLTDGMVIRNVSNEDKFANYTCTVLDRLSFTPLYSENIRLKLRQRGGKSFQSNNLIGEAREKHTNVWGIVNQWVKLQCNVLSRPRPTFKWRKEDNEEKIGNAANVFKIAEAEFTSNLSIFLHNETMFGKYICEASNNHGSSIQYFIVTEGYRPKSPLMYPVFISKDKLTLKVEPQEALMTGVATSSSKEKLPVTSYIIQYAEAEGLSTASGQVNKDIAYIRNKKWTTVRHPVPVHEISPYSKRDGGIFEVRNLKENTTYLVRSALANAAAISEFSPALRITTEASRQNVTASFSNTTNVQEDKITTTNRENFGRSSNYQPELENVASSVLISNTTNTQSMNSNDTTDCKTFRFKKTIIKSITTTTLIQDLEALSYNNAAENSSLVKKLVEENTSIDRMYLCSI